MVKFVYDLQKGIAKTHQRKSSVDYAQREKISHCLVVFFAFLKNLVFEDFRSPLHIESLRWAVGHFANLPGFVFVTVFVIVTKVTFCWGNFVVLDWPGESNYCERFFHWLCLNI